MYQELEDWKQYKREKTLLEICNEKTSYKEVNEFLTELISKQKAFKEFDEFMIGLAKKNGTTEY